MREARIEDIKTHTATHNYYQLNKLNYRHNFNVTDSLCRVYPVLGCARYALPLPHINKDVKNNLITIESSVSIESLHDLITYNRYQNYGMDTK